MDEFTFYAVIDHTQVLSITAQNPSSLQLQCLSPARLRAQVGGAHNHMNNVKFPVLHKKAELKEKVKCSVAGVQILDSLHKQDVILAHRLSCAVQILIYLTASKTLKTVILFLTGDI